MTVKKFLRHHYDNGAWIYIINQSDNRLVLTLLYRFAFVDKPFSDDDTLKELCPEWISKLSILECDRINKEKVILYV